MIADFLKQHGDYSNEKYFKDITTLKMGGHIEHYVLPNSFDDVKEIVEFLRKQHCDFKIIGNGSNLICGQSSYEGVVICLKKLNDFEISNDELYVQAGMMVPALANILAKQGLSCLEFASGIPGNIGGLISMNAGAYKSSMSDVVSEVLVLRNNEMIWLKNEDLNFSYRNSIFREHPHWVILAAKLKLGKKSSELIEELMADRLNRRKQTQPLDKPSAGSCFRNPEDTFAWKLIDGVGYRGFRVNGVRVSEKHSNFIINEKDGTAEDYLNIVYQIQKKVWDKYKIKLVMEVERFNC